GIPVYTNTPIAGAMRGYGSPQAFYAQQVPLRKIAMELNVDMVDIQLKNLVHPDSPDALHGKPIGNPRPIDCVKKGAVEFGWIQNRVTWESNENTGRFKRGAGMAVGLHGSTLISAHRDFTCLTLKMNEDGTAILFSGTHDMGNGSIRVQTMIIGEILGIDPDTITCNEADTDVVPYNLGDYGSRGTFVSGNAALKVAEIVKEEILKEASILLQENIGKLDLEDGFVLSSVSPGKTASIKDVILHAHRESQREIIASETYYSKGNPTSYGAHFAEVEVDTENGTVRVLSYVAVHDVGKAINPMGLEGQVEGAVQMGIGYALSEGLIIDENGRTVNNSFKKYKILRASEMPEIKVFFIEEGEKYGP
ncbi:MAG: molybdopterin-dependent oxidoreductase, partial [Spirochaetales bacterium]|nr:molybdopterin-dependent oxidoreductase [Spirochaetales bacterium]